MARLTESALLLKGHRQRVVEDGFESGAPRGDIH